MKITFHSTDYALISPRHLQSVLAGLVGIDFRALTRKGERPKISAPTALSISRISQDGGDDQAPWWGTEDIYGDKLPVPQLIGSFAVIPIKGVITSGLPRIYRALGMVDTEEISSWIQAAADNPSVSRIILDIDSPGGMVTGTPELADTVNRATLVKSVIAHTKGLMDSAAYWVASQANALYCTPSADVGCIGVYQVHYDYSACLADMGIDAEMFKSGDLKGAGHPDIPLTEDQKTHIQSEIDTIGEQFREAVKSKRTMVSDDSMRGQSFIGTEALKRNLVAGLRTFDSLF